MKSQPTPFFPVSVCRLIFGVYHRPISSIPSIYAQTDTGSSPFWRGTLFLFPSLLRISFVGFDRFTHLFSPLFLRSLSPSSFTAQISSWLLSLSAVRSSPLPPSHQPVLPEWPFHVMPLVSLSIFLSLFVLKLVSSSILDFCEILGGVFSLRCLFSDSPSPLYVFPFPSVRAALLLFPSGWFFPGLSFLSLFPFCRNKDSES